MNVSQSLDIQLSVCGIGSLFLTASGFEYIRFSIINSLILVRVPSANELDTFAALMLSLRSRFMFLAFASEIRRYRINYVQHCFKNSVYQWLRFICYVLGIAAQKSLSYALLCVRAWRVANKSMRTQAPLFYDAPR